MSTVNLLEISGDDIALLNDTDLRNLIGMLCEVDYRIAGLSTQGITWGGNQDAPDGGLDVVVSGVVSPPKMSFIPKKETGFQVKKPDMPKSAILKEMKPKGILREEIKTLIQSRGAYIIVSSSGSTSNMALKDRIGAMKSAIASEVGHEKFHVDFFDRNRIASWVRSHPAMILWVREKIGNPLKGWQPYGNWTNSPNGVEEEYLIDSKLRLFDGKKSNDDGVSVFEGLSKLKSALSTPKACVRLAGLSGVGKTRLAQALFDNRIGTNALNPSQVIYTDISDDPAPDPKTFTEQLLASKSRVILIVDNCTPELHRKLTKVCSQPQSAMSLLTVEYDVRDDVPEETNVFKLQPASEDIIEKLVLKRFRHISQVDARIISSFSDGNARVAIALANTVKSGETLSGFRDDELFRRLFWQRNNQDDRLLISAEACSLLYSFEGTDTSSDSSELKLLASLVDTSVNELFRDVKKLKDRQLVQSRGRWRAILPHAIANWLAKQALESIPKEKLMNTILNSNSERLIKSFTRRLNYLHDSEVAVEIVKDWLGPEGWIGNSIINLNKFGLEALKNIAPVSPEKTLEALERAANDNEKGEWFTSQLNPHFTEFASLLRLLAYDPILFKRSTSLLSQFVLSEETEGNRSLRGYSGSTLNYIKSLFTIYLSGTHASLEERAQFIKGLLNSSDPKKQELGLHLLNAALEARHFSSSNDFSFGARPRDYGYHPKTRNDVINWFDTYITICTQHALSSQPTAIKAKKLLAEKFSGLWTKAKMYEALENSANAICNEKFWNEGWIALNSVIRYDIKHFDKEVLKKIERLKKIMKPKNLFDRARTYTISEQHFFWDLEADIDTEVKQDELFRKLENTTREIGKQVAKKMEVLTSLLPDLVSAHNDRLFYFGEGLAEGSVDKKALWKIIYDQIEIIPSEKRQTTLLQGFLYSCAKSNPKTYNEILDELVNDDILGKWFPIFQTTSLIDQQGIKRLHKALDGGKADIYSFRNLANGRANESIGDDDLAALLSKILALEGGTPVVIQILAMRFFGQDNNKEYALKLKEITRDTLLKYVEDRNFEDQIDHEVPELAKVSLAEKEAISVVKKICLSLLEGIKEDAIYTSQLSKFLNVLARAQPEVFLNTFLDNDQMDEYTRSRIFSWALDMDKPLTGISDDVLIAWCEENPAKRYPLISESIELFTIESGQPEWRPLAYSLFENAPDMQQVLNNIILTIEPTSWSGSRADILQSRLKLFKDLQQHQNAEIRAWADNQYLNLQEAIMKERDFEARIRYDVDQSFE